MLTAVRIVRILLLAVLVIWVAAAPLAWILRDGLGPDAVDTAGTQAAVKFVIDWGIPALVIAVPLFVVWAVERRLASRTGRAS